MIERLTLSFFLGTASILYSQATPTASRVADVQVGIVYCAARPDYVQQTFQGIAAYADVDFRPHLGIEAEFHQVNHPGGYRSFQRTYEIGARYLRTYGPIVPYVKAMIGRGDFDYPYNRTNLAYNLFAGGVGADFKLRQFISIRGEYEFQKWTSFPTGGLMPQIFTIGVAYHFGGKTPHT